MNAYQRFGDSHPSYCSSICSKKHAIDISISIIFAISVFLIGRLSPRQHVFYEQDLDLSYPYVKPSIPIELLYLITVIFPMLLLFGFMFYIQRKGSAQRYSDTTRAVLFTSQSIIFSLLFTNILIIIIGRQRPNFFSLCDYNGFRASDMKDSFYAYLNLTELGRAGDIKNCRDKSWMKDAQRSFPSLSATISFSGLGSFSIFCYAALEIKKEYQMWKTILSLLPIFFASMISVLPILEYWHYMDDVIAGATIGCMCTLLAFSMNYPSSQMILSYSSPNSHSPLMQDFFPVK